MSMRLSDAEFQALRARGKVGSKTGEAILLNGKPVAAVIDGQSVRLAKARTAVRGGAWAPRHKFNAQRTERGGLKFASKAEAAYFDFLNQKQAEGLLTFFLMQVRFDMPGSRYLCDFAEFWVDGSVTFTDVKGMRLPAFEIKRRAVEMLYPLKIRICKMLKGGPRYEAE